MNWRAPGHPRIESASLTTENWGRPDRIEWAAEDCEIWVYDRTLWCGPIPIFLAPLPLVLPVCDGFDRIEFRGDTARVLHTRRSLLGGFFGGPGGGGAGVDPACRNPIPIPLRERIQPGRTVSLSVSIDTPEDQEARDYQEVSSLVRDDLVPALAQTGIFTEVRSAPESADYRLEVVVTTAEIRRKLFSWIEENHVVLKVQLSLPESGQRIGDFEIDRRSAYWRAGADEVVRPFPPVLPGMGRRFEPERPVGREQEMEELVLEPLRERHLALGRAQEVAAVLVGRAQELEVLADEARRVARRRAAPHSARHEALAREGGRLRHMRRIDEMPPVGRGDRSLGQRSVDPLALGA